MPNTYSKRISELTSKLDITPDLKVFLDSSYTNLRPALISEEFGGYQYHSLLVPTEQSTQTYNDETATGVHGTTFLSITDKETGISVLFNHGFKCSIEDYIQQLTTETSPSIESYNKSLARERLLGKLSFDNALIVDNAGQFRMNMASTTNYMDKLDVKSIFEKYFSFNPRESIDTLQHYFDTDNPAEVSYKKHGFRTEDLLLNTLENCTGEQDISALLSSVFKDEIVSTCKKFIGRVENGIALHCNHDMRENFEHYNFDECNFILHARGDSQLYRQQFIDQCHQMLEEPRYNSSNESTLNTGNTNSRTSTYFYRELIGDRIPSEAAIRTIDEGKFPLQQINNECKRSGLTKKQLKLAIHDWRIACGAKEGSQLDTSLQKMIGISSLPRNWLIKDNSPEDIAVLSNELQKNSLFAKSLLSCANKIDVYKHNNDKTALKSLAKEWSWLSQNTGTNISDKFKALNSKYNGDSIQDYSRILNTFINAIQLRVFSEHPSDFHNCFNLDLDSMQVSAQRSLQHAASEVFARECRANSDNYGDDEDWYNPIEKISYSETNGYYIHDRLASSVSLLHLFKGGDALHKNISSIYTELSSYHTENINWTPFIEDKYQDGAMSIEAISDRQSLDLEGTQMSHCVTSYLNQCLQGECYILSVKEQGERVATLELSADLYFDENDEEKLDVKVEQLMGKGNSAVNENIDEVVARFVEKLRSGEIRVNTNVVTENKELLYQCEAGGVAEYGHLKTIPHHTDAAYLAMHHLESHLSKHQKSVDVDSLFDATADDFTELFYISDFKKEYDLIKSLSNELNVTPELLIQTKNANKLLSFDKAAEVLSKNATVAEAITQTASSLKIEGTEILSKVIHNTLKSQFAISIPTDVLQEMDFNNPLSKLTTFINQQAAFADVVEDNYVFRDEPQSKMDAQFAMARR